MASALSLSGVPGHAAYPEAARNAIGQLLLMLRALGVTGPLRTLADQVGMEYDGLGLGIRCMDETSGSLTCNLGILRYNEKDGLYATLDIRYPILCDHAALTASVRAALEGVEVTVDEQKNPHHCHTVGTPSDRVHADDRAGQGASPGHASP